LVALVESDKVAAARGTRQNRELLRSAPLTQVTAVVVQEIECPHAEAVIVPVKMQPAKVWQGVGVARHELAVDDERAHAFQSRCKRAAEEIQSRAVWKSPTCYTGVSWRGVCSMRFLVATLSCALVLLIPIEIPRE
jgi:hypothetical protein